MPKSFESEQENDPDSTLLPIGEKNFDHANDVIGESTRKSATRLFGPIFMHLLVFALYTSALYVVSGWFNHQKCREPLVYCETNTSPIKLRDSADIMGIAPAQEAISYRKVNFNSDLFISSRFRGPPRPESDAAWHDLLENSNIRLSGEQLRRLGKSSVALADGSGYHGALNVHHHLHCLV